ncbi:3-isopropylmalate dehydratase [Halorientalis sp. IM1011]|uniref:proteasome assembly chaperone family protein n=1 Tax=Halorientalis sp. IM1011 TaxID=1932360 RepID=UPI00097CCF74|nr:PAC2 family protein [Halorientalis sp. IM1011]AQL41812.1 3-isopropylmalate dehydratase [Halorientalis sp. IM1011]
MAHVDVHDDRSLESPVLIEGLPGVGLVGKIATDHLVDAFDMSYYAACRCDGLPDVAVYHEGSQSVEPPVRIYADHDQDLLALQSDVPVSPSEATEFAACLSGWIAEQDALPLYLSGLPADKGGPPELHGVATGEAGDLLEEHDITAPPQSGFVSGPTGNLLSRAERDGLDSLGFVVESNAQFPDPEAARKLLIDAVAPVAGIDVDTQKLVDQAEEIAQARQQLAQQMGQAGDESSQAQPIGFQ